MTSADDGREARLEAVVAAVREAGPWPRCIDTQAGRYCLDCGIQAGLPHRDTCPGIRLRDALARYDDAEVAGGAQKRPVRDVGDMHE